MMEARASIKKKKNHRSVPMAHIQQLYSLLKHAFLVNQGTVRLYMLYHNAVFCILYSVCCIRSNPPRTFRRTPQKHGERISRFSRC